MLIIGIAGGTGSGKTTVVRKIVERLHAGEVVLLPQDSYYKDSSHLPLEERLEINFDHPDSIEFDLLTKHLKELRKGHSVEQPIYSYLTCTRADETITVNPRDVVIVEGILVLCNPELRKMMDLKVFVDADPDLCFIRRLQRDITERGRPLESVIQQYLFTVRPCYIEFVEPSKRFADVIIPEGGKNAVALQMVIARLKGMLDE